jgi:hypothetical protein
VLTTFVHLEYWNHRTRSLVALGFSFARLGRQPLVEAPLVLALKDIDSRPDISQLKPTILLLLRSSYVETNREEDSARISAALLENTRAADAKAGKQRKSLTAYRELALEVSLFALLSLSCLLYDCFQILRLDAVTFTELSALHSRASACCIEVASSARL